MPTAVQVEASAVYGSLTALSRTDNGPLGHVRWLCRCACGVLTTVNVQKLLTGHTKSCGCLKRALSGQRLKTHGLSRKHPSEYGIWKSMKSRCGNPNDHAYPDYGGRSIKVCDRWLASFPAFLADMGTRPPDGEIERKDNNAGYSPENCIWASRRDQCRNKRNSRRITANGVSRTLAEWSDVSGLPSTVIAARIQRGWTPADAVSLPRANTWYPTRKRNALAQPDPRKS